MKRLTNMLAMLFLIAIATMTGVSPGFAQTYPTNNPSYQPTAILAAKTCSAACDVVFTTNGLGTVTVRVSGSGTGVAAVVQGTESRAASPTYSTLTIHPVGSSATSAASAASIAGTGLWRVNAAGLASVRVHLTAVTGSITIGMSGGDNIANVIATPERKATYSASIVGLSPAASATDFVTLTGSATATLRVLHAECSGISTANATATVEALVRSTANSAGTPSAMTAVPHDSNDPAASGSVTAYTANPTTGTLTGIVRAGKLTTVTAASTTVAQPVLAWDFGQGIGQEVVLRGTGQVFALNGAGASFTSGASLNCSVTWTEE